MMLNIGKKLHSKVKYYGNVSITEEFTYLDFKNSIIKEFNISWSSNERYIYFNSSRDINLPISIPKLIMIIDFYRMLLKIN